MIIRTRVINCSHNDSRRPAMSMIEIVLSILLVGGLMVSALNTLSSSVQARQITSNKSQGYLLAQDLMSEIMQNRYWENSETSLFGRDIGELNGNRINFDDVDDYNNWSATPPQAKDGTILSKLEGWKRSVIVSYVYPDNLGKTSGTNMGVKKITLTIERDGKSIAVLESVKTSSESMSKAIRSSL